MTLSSDSHTSSVIEKNYYLAKCLTLQSGCVLTNRLDFNFITIMLPLCQALSFTHNLTPNPTRLHYLAGCKKHCSSEKLAKSNWRLTMRDEIDSPCGMCSYFDLEQLVLQSHPMRKANRFVEKALKALDGDLANCIQSLNETLK